MFSTKAKFRKTTRRSCSRAGKTRFPCLFRALKFGLARRGSPPSLITPQLCCYSTKNQNAPRPSEHPPVRGGKCRNFVVSHIQCTGCQPEKTTLHGGQSCSWSAEQGKENKRRCLAIPPPPYCSFGEIKNHPTHLQALRMSRSVSRPYKDISGSPTRHYANGCGFANM